MKNRAASLGRRIAGIVLLAGSGLATAADAPAAKSPDAKPAAPAAACMATLDDLSRGIPTKETGPALRSMGLMIRSPIIVPDGVITETSVVSAARVRVMIDSRGLVVPDSVTVQRSSGDPKLALAMTQAVPASLSFDVSGAFSVPDQFPFTTVYVVCASKKPA